MRMNNIKVSANQLLSRVLPVILLSLLVFGFGCIIIRPGENPLLGWKMVGSTIWAAWDSPEEQNPGHFPISIIDDYKDFLKHIPRTLKKTPPPIFQVCYFDDENQQHAIEITIPENGIWWKYVLIYNKDNKRIRTVKYASGRYMS